MQLLILSFIAGLLTALAPCVLPLLPVIIGGSVGAKDKKTPIIITIALAASIFLFTLILKVSTIFVAVPAMFWTTVSGGIILIFGLITLFPEVWDKLSLKLNLSAKSDELLNKSAEKKGLAGNILIGMSLGPVFASCSPTYALILATVLPQHFAEGVVYLTSYCVGLGLIMMLIGIYGQRLIQKLKWAADPHGWFKKVLGVLLVLVGIAVITGVDRTVETDLLNSGFLDVTQLELRLLQSSPTVDKSSMPAAQLLNVTNPSPAPEITGIDHWINSKGETIAGLKGKVVLIDFWTYSCINCIRTIPHLNEWYSKYKDKGLVIIGIHAPEFAFEHEIPNVEKAVKDYQIQYPVGMDNEYATWNAFQNQYWPAEYFIDKNGLVRHTHFGEGDYADDEKVLQLLLSEGGPAVEEKITDTNAGPPARMGETPETYLGYERMYNFSNLSQLKKDETATYTLATSHQPDYWTLGGDWQDNAMEVVAQSSGVILKLNFSAKEVYLVMSSPTEADVGVKILDSYAKPIPNAYGDDVSSAGIAKVKDARLYRLVKLDKFQNNVEIELTFPKGVSVNAFTFGS